MTVIKKARDRPVYCASVQSGAAPLELCEVSASNVRNACGLLREWLGVGRDYLNVQNESLEAIIGSIVAVSLAREIKIVKRR